MGEESCESICCDKSSRRCPSLLLRPLELGEGIPTWAQTHSILQLISPPSPPLEPFNESWHLAEAGIEARPFNGSSSQKVLASQEHTFCHMLPPVSAIHPQGWILHLAIGRDATCGWRPWVSHHQSLVGGQNRDAQYKAQGPFLDWALWVSSAQEMLSGQQKSQPLMGTNSKVRASLLCYTPIILWSPQGGSIPLSLKSQSVAA